MFVHFSFLKWQSRLKYLMSSMIQFSLKFLEISEMFQKHCYCVAVFKNINNHYISLWIIRLLHKISFVFSFETFKYEFYFIEYQDCDSYFLSFWIAWNISAIFVRAEVHHFAVVVNISESLYFRYVFCMQHNIGFSFVSQSKTIFTFNIMPV